MLRWLESAVARRQVDGLIGRAGGGLFLERYTSKWRCGKESRVEGPCHSSGKLDMVRICWRRDG